MEFLCYVYSYSLYNSYAAIYRHMCKITKKFKKNKYFCVHTCLAAVFGTGDTSRISMIYKWHFCRSHIFPLLSVRYCKTNSLNRNSGTPLCTYQEKGKTFHVYLLIVTSQNHRTVQGGKDVWRSSCPTPLLKAGSARAGCLRPCPVRFNISKVGDATASLGNLFQSSTILIVLSSLRYLYNN